MTIIIVHILFIFLGLKVIGYLFCHLLLVHYLIIALLVSTGKESSAILDLFIYYGHSIGLVF